jgi:hypothetical protein
MLEPHNQDAADLGRDIADARRRPRFKLQVDISVNSKTCGLLEGHSVDISESGISAMLRLEVPIGECVELRFTLPFGAVAVYGIVRQRNAFRYGFQFVESNPPNEAIRATCRSLSMEQSLFPGKQ